MAQAASARVVDNIARLRAVWRGRRTGTLSLWLRGERSQRVEVREGGLVGEEAVVLVSQAVARGHLRFRSARARSQEDRRGPGDRRALARVLLAAARSCSDVLARPVPAGRVRLGVPPAEAVTLLGDDATRRVLGRRLPAELLLREGHLTRGQLLAALEVGLLETLSETEHEEEDTSRFAPVDPELDARLQAAALPRSVPPPPEVPRPRRRRPPRLRLGPTPSWEAQEPGTRPGGPAVAFVAGIEPGPSVLPTADDLLPTLDPPSDELATDEATADGPTAEVPTAAASGPWGRLDDDQTEELFPVDVDEGIDDPETREPSLANLPAVSDAEIAAAEAAPAAPEPAREAPPTEEITAVLSGLPRVPWPDALEPVRGVADHILRVQAILVGRARDSVLDGDLEEARHALLRADTLAPDNPRVLVHLAWVELLMDPAGREAALERLYRAAATSPEDPVVGGFAAEISWLIREGRLG